MGHEIAPETHNAQITEARLGGWDGGYTMLTFSLRFKTDENAYFGFGDRNLGGPGQETRGAEHILSILRITDSADWSEIEGKYIRIRYATDGCKVDIRALGHITRDDWVEVV